MPDPRIERTRRHVVETVRRLLLERSGGPLTLTILAQEARVSRRTLYTYWGSIDRVIAEAVTLQEEVVESEVPAGVEERLRFFLVQVRESVNDPVRSAAYTSLMSQARSEDEAAESLTGVIDERRNQFTDWFGEMPQSVFIQLVGPIFFAGLTLRQEVSDELIETLVARGLELFSVATNPVT